MLGNANIEWFGYLMLYYGVWLVDDYVFLVQIDFL